MKRLTNCLACNSTKFLPLIDLGKQPLANAYSTKKTYPLAVQWCEDCFHAQLTHSIDPKVLYTDYAYVSGTTNTLNNWFRNFAGRFTAHPKGRILDIAGNDGSLLKHFKAMGWEVLNIDPAKNLKHFNDELGIPMINEFFSEEMAKEYGQFDVITAFNVVAHTPTPLDLLKGIRKALKPTGRAFVMTSQADMLQNGQFDTIYHEHHSFFTQNSMSVLLERAGFDGYVLEFDREPIHGGSMIVEIKRPYLGFKHVANEVVRFLKEDIPAGAIGYGAAAKATVMLNASGLKLDFVIDENPLKQGKTIPGTDIPIFAPDTITNAKKNLDIVILAWNFTAEIMAKVKNLRPKKKDKFYIPFPFPKVIE